MADETPDRDWPAQLTDAVVRIVDQVRAKTTRPAIKVARILVFGLVTLVVGGLALILLLIGALRGLDRALPGSVWTAYLTLSGVLLATGAILLTKAVKTPAKKELR